MLKQTGSHLGLSHITSG